MKQRKWEYIANKLKKMKAPAKVVNAAQELDNILVELGLGWNTEAWNAYSTECLLYYLVVSGNTCTACVQAEECRFCLLGADPVNETDYYCTPRNKYADNYYKIVRDWTYNNAETMR